MTTLARRLTDAQIATAPVDLTSLAPDLGPGVSVFWAYPPGWEPFTIDEAPANAVFALQPTERRGGQCSVTVTSAWALHGSIDPKTLLTGIEDPPPPSTVLVAATQDGPHRTTAGAELTMYYTFILEALTMTSLTRFDIITSGYDPSLGVLLQRTYNTPLSTPQPTPTPIDAAVTTTLLSLTDVR